MAGGVAGPSLDALLALAVVNDEDVGAVLATRRRPRGGAVLDARGVAVAVGQAGPLGVVAGLDVPPVPGGDKRRWVNVRACSSYSKATFRSLALTMCYIHSADRRWVNVRACSSYSKATCRSLALTMCYIHTADRRRATAGYIPVSRTHHVLQCRG